MRGAQWCWQGGWGGRGAVWHTSSPSYSVRSFPPSILRTPRCVQGGERKTARMQECEDARMRGCEVSVGDVEQ